VTKEIRRMLNDTAVSKRFEYVRFRAVYVGALRVGDEIIEICGISVQGRTVDFLQKMLVSARKLCCRKDYRAMLVTAQSDNTHIVFC